MEKQLKDQEATELREKRKQLGLADFEPADENQVAHVKDDLTKGSKTDIPEITPDEQPEPLSPFRRSGEPGSRK